MKTRFGILALAFFAVGTGNAWACNTRGTCLGIQWCMNGANGHEFSGPITQAATNGDGNGVGVDTAACQHKYGQHSTPPSWDGDSAGCSNPDYAALGKKALGGNPGTCD
jgi:hypothetical protein